MITWSHLLRVFLDDVGWRIRRNILLRRFTSRLGVLLVPGRIVQVHPGQVTDIAVTPGAGDGGEEVGWGASTPWEEQLKVNHRREATPGLVWVLNINMLKDLIMIWYEIELFDRNLKLEYIYLLEQSKSLPAGRADAGWVESWVKGEGRNWNNSPDLVSGRGRDVPQAWPFTSTDATESSQGPHVISRTEILSPWTWHHYFLL